MSAGKKLHVWSGVILARKPVLLLVLLQQQNN